MFTFFVPPCIKIDIRPDVWLAISDIRPDTCTGYKKKAGLSGRKSGASSYYRYVSHNVCTISLFNFFSHLQPVSYSQPRPCVFNTLFVPVPYSIQRAICRHSNRPVPRFKPRVGGSNGRDTDPLTNSPSH